MQDETQKTETTTAATADPALGCSAVAKLPAELREAVDKAIAGGVTVDEITAGIRDAGENCSRSAAGRDATDTRDLLRTQREAVRVAKTWIEEFDERPQGEVAQVLIEGLRAMACAAMRHLAKQKEPPSTEDIARLSLAPEAPREHRRAAPPAEAGGAEGGRGGEAQAQASEGALAGDGRPHRRGRTGEGPVARGARRVGAGGPVESRRIPLSPGKARRNVPGDRSSGVSHQPHVDPVPRAGTARARDARACGRRA